MTSEEKNSSNETQVHQAISGISYPATKDELIEYAKSRNSSDEIIDQLESLPSIEYINEPQVLTTIREYKS